MRALETCEPEQKVPWGWGWGSGEQGRPSRTCWHPPAGRFFQCNTVPTGTSEVMPPKDEERPTSFWKNP